MTEKCVSTPYRPSTARPGDEIAPTSYRKKPVVIEAIRWSGTNLKEVIDFTSLHPSADKWAWEEYAEVVRERGLKIFSLEGSNFIVTKGDYIIKGVKGEFYACKPDIFWMTYERANVPASETKAHSSSPEWQAAMATSKLFGEGASDKRWSTPRADAAAYWPEGKDIGNECVDAETARRLERELAEVKKYAAFVDAEIDALRGGRPTSAIRPCAHTWVKVVYGEGSITGTAWPGESIYFIDGDRQRWRYDLPALPDSAGS